MATFHDVDTGMFIEGGAIYRASQLDGGRPLRPDEPVVRCPNCGQRFAATPDDSAEACRDEHVVGWSTICQEMADGLSGPHLAWSR